MVTELYTGGRQQCYRRPQTLAVPIIYKLMPHYAQITIRKYSYIHATFRRVSVAVSAIGIIRQDNSADQNAASFRLSILSCTHIFMWRPLQHRACLCYTMYLLCCQFVDDNFKDMRGKAVLWNWQYCCLLKKWRSSAELNAEWRMKNRPVVSWTNVGVGLGLSTGS